LRIPIAISKYLLYFRLKVIQINEKSVVYSIHSEEGSMEKVYDFCFLKGIFEGTIMLFQIKNWKLIVEKTINSEVDGKYIESAGELNSNESLIRMEWEDSTIQVGKSALNASLPPRVSQTFVISETDNKENVEFSYIDLNAVINKSKELVIENRDLEAAVEVLNSLRDEMIVKHKAISKDLRMARNIQRGIIPQHIQDWKGLQFDFSYLPMQEVSGDYYDYFNFGSNKIGIMLSDVSGHGVPAAFITAISKLLFTNYKLDSPAEIFSNANRELIDRPKPGWSQILPYPFVAVLLVLAVITFIQAGPQDAEKPPLPNGNRASQCRKSQGRRQQTENRVGLPDPELRPPPLQTHQRPPHWRGTY
jgi:hypothetical protein